MKAFQSYIAELNKLYEFKVKIAGVEPKGEIFERIKNALDAYQVETVSNPKRLPIQEHRDFPKLGPCECYLIEVTLQYPTTTDHVRQLITSRAMIDPACVCVYTKDQHEQEDMVQERIDNQGPVLSEPDLKAEAADDIAGQGRVSSLIKELESRKYEFAAKSDATGKTTNDTPQNTKSVLKPNTSKRGQ
jgi:hypothetical protein